VRIAAYLRAVAADDRQALSAGAFDVFLDRDSDHPYRNYAIPRDGAKPSQDDVAEIVLLMQRAGRLPRAELLTNAAPAAESALREYGFEEERRTALMTRDADAEGPVELAKGVDLAQLGPDAERDQVEGLMRALALAFGERFDPATVDSAASRLTRRIAVLAYADEEIAGGGLCLEPVDGVIELVGIGVREEFRKRGIGTAVTAELARLAFENGAELAFLLPGSDDSSRIYERAGFERTDELVHMAHRA
jgi:ribosomal protein S18 acetylase RimI-like enzyme